MLLYTGKELTQTECWDRTWHTVSTQQMLVIIMNILSTPLQAYTVLKLLWLHNLGHTQSWRPRARGLESAELGHRAEGWAVMGQSREGSREGSNKPSHTSSPPCLRPGHVLALLPHQDSAPGCGLHCGCSSHAAAQFSGSSRGPRTAHSPAQSRGLK